MGALPAFLWVCSLVIAAGVPLSACESRPSASPAGAEPSTRRPLAAAARAPEAPAPLVFVELVTGGASASEPLPLVVAIHGLGDQPRGFAGVFRGFDAKARVLLPAGPDAHMGGFTWFPFRRDRDEAELAQGISAAAKRIAAFLEWARARRPTLGKPIVTGFSQGGMISFALAVKHPSTVAAVLPIGGLIPAPLTPEAAPAAAPRIIAFHGEADPIVPFEPTQRAVAHLKAVGYMVDLRAYPGVGHNVPPAMRAALHDALRGEIAKLAGTTP